MNRKLVAPFNFNNWLKLTGRRRYSAQKNNNNDISKLRNIGILAHIDAGILFFPCTRQIAHFTK